MVEWLAKQDYRGNNPLDRAIMEARRLLAEEQAQKPTAPAGLVEEIEKQVKYLEAECDCDCCLETREALTNILSRYPSTAKSADRCGELTRKIMTRISEPMYGGSLPGDEWGPGSEFFYKTDVSNMLTDLRTILDEFSKDADGKETTK